MKKHILIIFGGRSSEHQVSCMSASSIEKYIDTDKFTTSVLGITNQGQWHFGDKIANVTKDNKVVDSGMSIADATAQLLSSNFDMIFPIIHGTNGEDGTLQGLLEFFDLPYVGADILGSAICMDKQIQKSITGAVGLPQTKYLSFYQNEWKINQDQIINDITDKLDLPVFAKPANLGSSVGINKAKTKEQLANVINEALQYDTKCIVEQAVPNMVEVEVSVLGNSDSHPKASVCGSIKPHSEFYDYQTKYVTDDIDSQIPANIPTEISDKIRQIAISAYTALNCDGLARVDFFYQPETQKIFLNELNTLPGFTHISMYPKLWQATDLSYTDLITELIYLGEQKYQQLKTLKRDL